MSEIETGYSVLSSDRYFSQPFIFRAVLEEDIETIRIWRNAQMDVLRQSTELSRSMQQEYFRAFVWPEKRSLSPRQILFSILQDDDLIGYGGLTNISWVDKRAEVSFLLAPSLERDASQKGRVFSSFLVFLRNLSFRELELQRIFCETFSHRLQHVQILEDVGFLKEGVLRGHAVVGGERVDSLIHGSLYEDWRT